LKKVRLMGLKAEKLTGEPAAAQTWGKIDAGLPDTRLLRVGEPAGPASPTLLVENHADTSKVNIMGSQQFIVTLPVR
jgi:hypothetical protein